MANEASVSRAKGPRRSGSPSRYETTSELDDSLSDSYVDALLGAKAGDFAAAESFADQLIAAFNKTPQPTLRGKSADDAFRRLAARLASGSLRGAL